MKKSRRRNRKYRRKVKKTKKAGMNENESIYMPLSAQKIKEQYFLDLERNEELNYPHRMALHEQPKEVKELIRDQETAVERFNREEAKRRAQLDEMFTHYDTMGRRPSHPKKTAPKKKGV